MKDIKKLYRIKLIFIILLITILINHTTISIANTEENEDDEKILYENIIQELEKENNSVETSASNQKPVINSRRYVIYDRNSKSAIYGKDENKQTAMASTTKIMTATVVLETCKDLNEVVTISAKAAGTGGSTLGIHKGDKITVNDLLYGLLLRSGNDTAVALAEYIGGSVEEFSVLMNNKAKEIGLENTHFVTPHGLDDPNHYTTAYELAYLTDYALRNEKFADIVKTKYATISINGVAREIKNTNELLLSDVEGIYGVKTGFTNNAGRCLVTAVKRNNMDLIVVVLGADTRKDRAKDSLKLINYAFKEYKLVNVEEIVNNEFNKWKEINENRIYINKGRNNVELETSEIEVKSIVTNKDISVEINALNYLEAPVEKGKKLGTVIIKNGEEIIEEVSIITSKEVERKNILDYLYIYAKLLK